MEEYITPNYETISVVQKRELMELMSSTLLNAFSEQDYFDVLNVFRRIIERLENIEKGGAANSFKLELARLKSVKEMMEVSENGTA